MVIVLGFMFICIIIYNVGLSSRPTSSSWGRLGKYVYLTTIKSYGNFTEEVDLLIGGASALEGLQSMGLPRVVKNNSYIQQC